MARKRTKKHCYKAFINTIKRKECLFLMKKRIISAFAALLMLFSVLALAVSADNGQFKLSKPGRITAGSTFTLTMKLAGIDTAVAEQGIVSVSFDLAASSIRIMVRFIVLSTFPRVFPFDFIGVCSVLLGLL